MNNIVTYDLSRFGNVERNEAADLLKAFNEEAAGLDNCVRIGFNTHSGRVWLEDEEYNIAMLNEAGNLEKWARCGECGYEDFISNFNEEDDDAPACYRCPECNEEVY